MIVERELSNGVSSVGVEPETLNGAMAPLYVVGGRQRVARSLAMGNNDWNGYDRGQIVRLDPRSGEWAACVEYVSPPEVVAEEDPAILFQAGSLEKDRLYLCTQTEVMIYSLPRFERLWYLTLPIFNDLHHVKPAPNGNLLVANAGLEMVLEISLTGEVVREWNVLGEEPWGRFARDVDYRGISTKPHRSHPNHIFTLGDEIWVTRFHQGDVICLNDPQKRIPLSSERIHDGVLYEGLAYFTTVNSKVIVANPRTLKVETIVDLQAMHEEDVLLGWCRGLKIDQGTLWVGFSRIRPTKFRENVAWVLRRFKRLMPTHIGLYDLDKRQCLAEIDLEPMGLSAVYSLFPAFE
jgi:hypothetical protein